MVRRWMTAILLGLIAMVSLPTGAGATPSAAPALATILYHDAFARQGLRGWTADRAHWSSAGTGVVRFDGSGSSEIHAPFSTAHRQDFAVRARIRAVGRPAASVSGYGLLVRAAGNGTATAGAIHGGSYFSPETGQTEPKLTWNRDEVAGFDVEPHGGYNTYRLVVHGAAYTLWIDGLRVVSFTIPASRAGTSVGVWGLNRQLEVSSFTVTLLRPAAPLPALPPVKKINLGPADVPSILQLSGGHYYTDEEVARLDSSPLDIVAASGQKMEYEVSYAAAAAPASGPFGLSSYVTAFTAARQAKTRFADDWSGFQQQWTANAGYAAGTIGGLGGAAHTLRFDYTETGYGGPGFNASVVGLFFRRGAYEVFLFADFIRDGVTPDAMTQQLVALGKIVDQRIQRTAPQRA